MIFIVGQGRSGTHWLARSLQLSGLSCSMEKHLKMVDKNVIYDQNNWNELISTFRKDKSKVHKCHPLLWRAERLLQEFPRAKIIAIRREQKPTVKSMMKHAAVRRWCEVSNEFKSPNKFLGMVDHDSYDHLPTKRKCELRWKSHDDEILRLKKILPRNQFLVVHYESLELEKGKLSTFLNRPIKIEKRK